MKVLILFSTRTWPMRSSQSEHLWSFKKYIPDAKCYYVNLGFGGFPSYLKLLKYDLIIYDWSFVGDRVMRVRFKSFLHSIEHLKTCEGIKICLPQDEFTCMDILCDFINDFGVNFVFSVAAESEWSKIYHTVDRDKTKINRVLTGYLDEGTINRWKDIKSNHARSIDIGYRTVASAMWGRFNLLKADLATIFNERAKRKGLVTDIKVGDEHFIIGEEWLKFLSSCRYTLGVEGGSRILDWDGKIYEAVVSHSKNNPKVKMKDLAMELIPYEREGEINVVAISPRHLEACLTKTVQILIEGDYNGILKPNIHYIPVHPDFSNVNDIMIRIDDEKTRCIIAENAFNDIVLSNKYTYRSFIETVLNISGVLVSSESKRNLIVELSILINIIYLKINLVLVSLLSRARSIRDYIRIRKYR